MSMVSSAFGLPRRLAMAVMSRFEPSEATEIKVELSDALDPEDENPGEPRTG
jgi:hypothetical protein